jgi:hypothetical protein
MPNLEAMVEQRFKIYYYIWHLWLPRKILAMIWLIVLIGGLPIATWRTKIKQEGVCTLCMEGILKRIEHGFMKCITMIEAWNNFRDLKTKCSL